MTVAEHPRVISESESAQIKQLAAEDARWKDLDATMGEQRFKLREAHARTGQVEARLLERETEMGRLAKERAEVLSALPEVSYRLLLGDATVDQEAKILRAAQDLLEQIERLERAMPMFRAEVRRAESEARSQAANSQTADERFFEYDKALRRRMARQVLGWS